MVELVDWLRHVRSGGDPDTLPDDDDEDDDDDEEDEA